MHKQGACRCGQRAEGLVHDSMPIIPPPSTISLVILISIAFSGSLWACVLRGVRVVAYRPCAALCRSWQLIDIDKTSDNGWKASNFGAGAPVAGYQRRKGLPRTDLHIPARNSVAVQHFGLSRFRIGSR